MNLYEHTGPLNENFHQYLDIKTTDGEMKRLVVYKNNNFNGTDWDWIWSDLVWMYWEKQQMDGEAICASKLDLNKWLEGGGEPLYAEFMRMRKMIRDGA